MVLLLRKERFLRQSIRKSPITGWEYGMVNWVMGLFLTLFLAIILLATLQIRRFSMISLYMEDAVAASNLASAIVDVEEYGISKVLLIASPPEAYERYKKALQGNLNLDRNMRGYGNGVLQSEVVIENYTVYNVKGGVVEVYRYTPEGWTSWEAVLGAERAPNGLLIENTSIYSEISSQMEVLRGVYIRAVKDGLADIVGGGG